MPPTAVVMNMFYTGLGIARSLGEHNIPVIGLTAQRGVFGNFTRYARIIRAPNSRSEPEALLHFLLSLGRQLGHRSVIFPTRDDDLVFLDRFRHELEPSFILTITHTAALTACLDKWETFMCARRAEVPTPKTWLIKDEDDLHRASHEVSFPCVLKPVAAHEWRKAGNWDLVGCRKAIGVTSYEELRDEYRAVARAEQRVLLQETVSGSDDCLFVAACYLDRQSSFIAGFNAQKLLQVPEGFGTGCIVQSVHRPELFAPAIRLLQNMRFTGIAEVEFKWDAASKEYKLIEINPRPWDQHRLGHACSVDLIYCSYCQEAGLSVLFTKPQVSAAKWIAEDVFLLQILRLAWRRSREVRNLLGMLRGKRICGIWSLKDPFPGVAFSVQFISSLFKTAFERVWRELITKSVTKSSAIKKDTLYDSCPPKTTHLR